MPLLLLTVILVIIIINIRKKVQPKIEKYARAVKILHIVQLSSSVFFFVSLFLNIFSFGYKNFYGQEDGVFGSFNFFGSPTGCLLADFFNSDITSEYKVLTTIFFAIMFLVFIYTVIKDYTKPTDFGIKIETVRYLFGLLCFLLTALFFTIRTFNESSSAKELPLPFTGEPAPLFSEPNNKIYISVAFLVIVFLSLLTEAVFVKGFGKKNKAVPAGNIYKKTESGVQNNVEGYPEPDSNQINYQPLPQPEENTAKRKLEILIQKSEKTSFCDKCSDFPDQLFRVTVSQGAKTKSYELCKNCALKLKQRIEAENNRE